MHPLFNLGVTGEHVVNFWNGQIFDLNLPGENNYFGNCDLCFLKSAEKIKRIIAWRPELADFWIDLEEIPRDRNNLFRRDRPTYRELRDKALAGDLSFEREDPFINDCSCTE